jgi:RNA polymerase sigma-70 factor (ECF subfamily)
VARAELHRRLGRAQEAAESYQRALVLNLQERQRRFIERRRRDL